MERLGFLARPLATGVMVNRRVVFRQTTPTLSQLRLFSDAREERTLKPPLNMKGMSGNFATYLYVQAKKANKLDACEKDLKAAKEYLTKNPEAARTLTSFTATAKDRDGVVATLTKGASPHTVELFDLLKQDSKYLRRTEGVIDQFLLCMKKERKEITAKVISSTPLSAAQLKTIEAHCKDYLNSDEVLDLQAKVDTRIIGGLKIEIIEKGLAHDATVKSQIRHAVKAL
jgi:F-type H+-transporting ATPase subunit O